MSFLHFYLECPDLRKSMKKFHKRKKLNLVHKSIFKKIANNSKLRLLLKNCILILLIRMPKSSKIHENFKNEKI